MTLSHDPPIETGLTHHPPYVRAGVPSARYSNRWWCQAGHRPAPCTTSMDGVDQYVRPITKLISVPLHALTWPNAMPYESSVAGDRRSQSDIDAPPLVYEQARPAGARASDDPSARSYRTTRRTSRHQPHDQPRARWFGDNHENILSFGTSSVQKKGYCLGHESRTLPYVHNL